MAADQHNFINIEISAMSYVEKLLLLAKCFNLTNRVKIQLVHNF